MKKRYIIMITLSLTAALSSCQKWLEMPSDTKFNSETVFTTVSRAEMAVEGAYSQTFNRELYYQFGMGTDACISTEGETNSKNQVANFVYNTSNIPTSTYTAMYTGIEYANVCIKNIPAMSVDASQQKYVNMLLGESYAIRAMNYLNLVRFFGDVPYPKAPIADQESFTSSRVSRDTIIDGCVKDLQKAIELLPWYKEGMINTPERFSKNAALGLLARTALYGAGYSLRWDLNSYAAGSVTLSKRSDAARVRELYNIAAEACKQIIDRGENSLLPRYETVFRDLVNGRYNGESIFEYGQTGANVNGSAIGYTNGMFAHTNSMFGKSGPAMHVLPSYYFDFDANDTRRDVAICNYGVAADNTRQMSSYTGLTIGKYRVTWKAGQGTAINKRDINWPWLRYSDVLLMYAEALNELNNGPSTDAIRAFEQVRTRAFGDPSKIGQTPVSYAGFRTALIKEYGLELEFEGWRRTDLVRWGVMYETLTNAKQRVIDMANQTGLYANIDIFRAYKKEKATSFSDPVVAVPFIGYKAEPTAAEKSQLTKDGYTLVSMKANGSLSNSVALQATAPWVVNLYRGLEKNKVETFPLNSTTIDDNPGLQGQQHPLY